MPHRKLFLCGVFRDISHILEHHRFDEAEVDGAGLDKNHVEAEGGNLDGGVVLHVVELYVGQP